MTNTSQDRERTNNRITYAATNEGIERAEQALKRLGIASKKSFAESRNIPRTAVSNFFNGKPMQLDGFQTICNELKLSNWQEIAGIKSFDSNGKVKPELNSCNQTIEEDKVTFSITGSVDKKDIAKLKSLIQLARKLANDDLIDVIDIEQGSIKLTLTGSPAGLKRLEQLFQSGELTKIFKQELDITVEDVSFIDAPSLDNEQQNQVATTEKKQLAFTISGDVSQADINILKAALIDTSDDDKEIKNQEKIRLIKEIRNQCAKGQNLSGADLSGADLSYAYLSGADLRNANLSGADLSRAKLISADLRNANLISADLIGVNLFNSNLSRANLSRAKLICVYLIRAYLKDATLSDAYLIRAYLEDATLSGAIVKSTLFMNNFGISQSLKRDLIARGAIFEDSPGDRSEILTPV